MSRSIVFKNWLYRRINEENNHILFLLFQQNSSSPDPCYTDIVYLEEPGIHTIVFLHIQLVSLPQC